MKIDEELLYSSGAEIKKYNQKDVIFQEGNSPLYYFQIISGTVIINNYNEQGKEFIHNILGETQSFGDSLLFIDKNYPMNAVAITDCSIIRLPKEDFLNLLRAHPKLSLEMNACLSHRMYYNLIMTQNMASKDPVVRLTGLLNYFKSYQKKSDVFSFKVQLTRQQIADLTGLRVETVIRTFKKMEKDNILQIIDQKVFY